MKSFYSRPTQALATALAVATLTVPAFAHNIGKKGYDQLKSETENFAHAKSTSSAKINRKLPYFAVKTIYNKGFTNASFLGKIGVFVLADTQCPCVQAVEERLKTLAKRYGKNGVKVVYVFSKPGERALDVARFMQNHQIPFPAVIDTDQRLLKMLDGKCSSEVYVTDKRGLLRYHGRVDDSTFDPKAVQKRDLERAIVQIARNQTVTQPEVPAMGCAIPRI